MTRPAARAARPVLARTVAAALAVVSGCAAPEPAVVDLVLRGGTVIDGSGAQGRVADVAIAGGRIRAVGRDLDVLAERTIDASGLIVAPGFVDLHSHADLILLADRATQERLLAAKVAQGVTTVVVGNCGLGVAPSTPAAEAILADLNGWMTPDGVSPGALSVGEYLRRLGRRGVALNVGTLVPHGPVRISAMGLAAGAPTPAQLRTMERAVELALDEGALGLSTGLIYPPGMFSDTDELVALARVVAARERLFTSHVRGSSETLLRATEELVEIARRSGAPVHHSHLEAVGERFWPDVARVLALEDAARAAGLRVSHDVFLYTRAATMMSAIFPPWALEGGIPALLARLRDPVARERLRRELATSVPEWPPWRPGGWPHNIVGAVGWDGILVASVRPGGPRELVGRSLDEIADARGRDPFDVVADLMLSQEGHVGQLVAEISGRPDRVDVLLSILAHSAASVVTDAEDYGRGTPHPAHAGGFARALRLNRDYAVLPLPELLRKMTSKPASVVGLGDRGVLRSGAAADLVVLDPERVADRATWEHPRLTAEGVRWVVINGHVAVEDGRYVGGLFGEVLRAGSSG